MSSRLRAEALEAPEAVARLMRADAALYARLGDAWRADPPAEVVTLARGSSDHAAAYFAMLLATRLGRFASSLPPSTVTLYGTAPAGAGLLALAFSQSGRSPDLIEALGRLRRRGSRSVAIVNDAASPLAGAAEFVLPLHAGPEGSIAATKSFVAQLVVGARLAAAWAADAALTQALQALPESLSAAAGADWAAATAALQDLQSLYVIGRGTGLPLAREAALKLKEVCGMHAEAMSSAELHHGPKALLGPGFGALVFALPGPAQAGLLEAAGACRALGAPVVVVAPADTPVDDAPGLRGVPCVRVPTPDAMPDDLQPVVAVQAFYPWVEALARARGLDPDSPRHLTKVTLTR